MALLLLDGCEDATWSNYKWPTRSATVTSTAGSTTGNAYRLNGNQSYIGHTLSSAASSLIIGFRVRILNTTNNGSLVTFYNLTDGITHCGLAVNPISADPVEMKFFRSTTSSTLITSAQDWAKNTWYWCELKVTISDTVGVFELKRNGTVVMSGTSLDTKNAGTSSNIEQVRIFSPTSGDAADFDDIYICDTTGSAYNDYLGELAIETLKPNGNGNYSQLVGSDGNSTDNYALVDETSPDTADYVHSSTATDKDTYTYGDLAATAGTIKGVMVSTLASKTGTSARTLKNKTRISSTDYDGSATTLNYGAEITRKVWEVSPATTSDWTISEVNGAEFGFEVG